MRRVCTPLAALLFVASGTAFGQCSPTWTALPVSVWPNDEVLCLKSWDRGALPPLLLVGGNMEFGGTQALNYAGLWTGAGWQSMGSGFNGSATSVTLFDPDGPGALLPGPVFGGVFTTANGADIRTVARWDGTQWLGFGSGVSGGLHFVEAVCQWNDELFATGPFEIAGGVPADGAARWAGGQWLSFPDSGARAGYALQSHQGQVYVGTPLGVRRWTGSQWVWPGPNPPTDSVYALTSWRGKLVAAGWFNSNCCGNPPPPQPGQRIAVFDGNNWSPLGTGTNAYINAICAFDPDGPGPLLELLIAGGIFTTAGGQPASRIAAWDGNQWFALGPGVNNEVNALAVFQNQLYVGGFFTTAGGLNSPYLAIWGCQQLACYPNCDQSTATPSLTANDFMCFINKFANRDSYANCDQSTNTPALTANDFMCFINKFAAGCP